MKKDLILENVERILKLTDSEKKYFLQLLSEKTLRKKQFLVHSGETCSYTAFVTDGCLRSYSVDRNGFEHILQFAPPGWWIADMGSLVSGQPGKLNIDALIDSEMLILDRDRQEKLLHELPKFERFFRILMEKSIAATSGRLLDYMGLSAQERYTVFEKRYPTLLQTLPQKHIAAYIGVTPEFLSKLKAGMLKRR